MSTSAVSYQLSHGRGLLGNTEAPATPSMEDSRDIHSYGESFAQFTGLEFRPAGKTAEKNISHRQTAVRTKRRLKGFLVELQRDEARVAFVEDGQTILYDLPADQVQRAGIKMRNQPFQMDEIEMEDEHGALIVGYRFLALAKPSDAYIETLNFDEERKRKRALILKEFGHTQD